MFNFKTDKFGYEFGALQFDIIADTDVEGYWTLYFYLEGGTQGKYTSRLFFASGRKANYNH